MLNKRRPMPRRTAILELAAVTFDSEVAQAELTEGVSEAANDYTQAVSTANAQAAYNTNVAAAAFTAVTVASSALTTLGSSSNIDNVYPAVPTPPNVVGTFTVTQSTTADFAAPTLSMYGTSWYPGYEGFGGTGYAWNYWSFSGLGGGATWIGSGVLLGSVQSQSGIVPTANLGSQAQTVINQGTRRLRMNSSTIRNHRTSPARRRV